MRGVTTVSPGVDNSIHVPLSTTPAIGSSFCKTPMCDILQLLTAPILSCANTQLFAPVSSVFVHYRRAMLLCITVIIIIHEQLSLYWQCYSPVTLCFCICFIPYNAMNMRGSASPLGGMRMISPMWF